PEIAEPDAVGALVAAHAQRPGVDDGQPVARADPYPTGKVRLQRVDVHRGQAFVLGEVVDQVCVAASGREHVDNLGDGCDPQTAVGAAPQIDDERVGERRAGRRLRAEGRGAPGGRVEQV